MISESKEFLKKHLFMIEIYITYLLEILRFSSRFRQFETKNFLCRPTIVAGSILQLVAPQIFFHFYGPATLLEIELLHSYFPRILIIISRKVPFLRTPLSDCFYKLQYLIFYCLLHGYNLCTVDIVL